MSDERENKKGMTIPVLDKGYVRLIDFMGSDQRIVESARISYNSPSKGVEQDNKLLAYLWRMKHFSPFEMCQITLNIKMPIFIHRQYVRHRTQSMNERSLRYTEPEFDFYIPKSWRKQDTKNKQGSIDDGNWNPEISIREVSTDTRIGESATDLLQIQCDNAHKTYNAMISAGIAREMARMVLPVNLYTEFYATWDLRNLLHFISLRDDSHAQSEIQDYSRAIKEILCKLFPETMKCYEKYKWELVEKD